MTKAFDASLYTYKILLDFNPYLEFSRWTYLEFVLICIKIFKNVIWVVTKMIFHLFKQDEM